MQRGGGNFGLLKLTIGPIGKTYKRKKNVSGCLRRTHLRTFQVQSQNPGHPVTLYTSWPIHTPVLGGKVTTGNYNTNVNAAVVTRNHLSVLFIFIFDYPP